MKGFGAGGLSGDAVCLHGFRVGHPRTIACAEIKKRMESRRSTFAEQGGAALGKGCVTEPVAD
jgi:hypothetical protein